MPSELNKAYIAFHLKEVAEAAGQMLVELERDPTYDVGAYFADMTHLYHHVNSAWNARHSTQQQAERCSESDFNRWRQYPDDLPLL